MQRRKRHSHQLSRKQRKLQRSQTPQRQHRPWVVVTIKGKMIPFKEPRQRQEMPLLSQAQKLLLRYRKGAAMKPKRSRKLSTLMPSGMNFSDE